MTSPKKIKIANLARELGANLDELIKLKVDKVPPGEWSGFGKLSWLTPRGAEMLRTAFLAPLAMPTLLRGEVVHAAPNPRWVYVKIDGMEGKHPVAIPLKLRGILRGKRIPIESITDASGGTTYRHAILGQRPNP